MKKVFISMAAILAMVAAVSCKKVVVKTDTTVKVELPGEAGDTPAVELAGLGEFDDGTTVETDAESGERTVISVETVSGEAEMPIELGSKPKSLGTICDMSVKIPLSKNPSLPSDDIFKALAAPYIRILVKNEQGRAFKYSSNLNSKSGEKFKVEANIPATIGDVFVFVSENGNVVDENDNNVNAKAIKDFPQVFEGSPDEILITDAAVSAIEAGATSASRADATSGSISFAVQSFFPFTVKNGVPFTMRKTIDLSKADFSQFLSITKLEADIFVKNSMPLELTLALVEPENITVTCPKIQAALNGPTHQKFTVKAECPSGVTAFPRAVVDITAVLRGSAESYSVDEKATLEIGIQKDEKGKQMISVTGKIE